MTEQHTDTDGKIGGAVNYYEELAKRIRERGDAFKKQCDEYADKLVTCGHDMDAYITSEEDWLHQQDKLMNNHGPSKNALDAPRISVQFDHS